MNFSVYLLISKIKDSYVTYVGYTNNLKNRVKLHNSSKGAKFTKCNNSILVYEKRYNNKSDAMKAEYKLKNDKKKRLFIKMKYINNL